jgi:hypothetical protein
VLATVTHNGQPALAMTVDPGSGAVVEIAVPTIQFCD